jgi:hypothetical protein
MGAILMEAILRAGAIIRHELRELKSDSIFDQRVFSFLEQKTSARDVITAINILLREANQEPVFEVTYRDILVACDVLRLKEDPLYSARLIRCKDGLAIEKYVPEEKLKRMIMQRIKEHVDVEIPEDLTIEQLKELEEKVMKGRQ